MGLSFQYWYLLPISVLIATIAMSSGIGGAVFFLTAFYLSAEIGAIDCYRCSFGNGAFRFRFRALCLSEKETGGFQAGHESADVFDFGSYTGRDLQ